MSNRMLLMVVLLAVLIGSLFVGDFGTAELTIWLVLMGVWIAVTLTWARSGRKTSAKH